MALKIKLRKLKKGNDGTIVDTYYAESSVWAFEVHFEFETEESEDKMKQKKSPTVIDVLKRMRVLLRKGWTQRAYARSAANRVTLIKSPRATQFCLYGARDRVMYELRVNNFQLENRNDAADLAMRP